MTCHHRDMGLFIGNLNKAQGLLACLIWEGEELDWLLSRHGRRRRAPAGHNQSSGAPLYTEEIEQRGDKWDGGVSLSVGPPHRTIAHYLVTALLFFALHLSSTTFISSAISVFGLNGGLWGMSCDTDPPWIFSIRGAEAHCLKTSGLNKASWLLLRSACLKYDILTRLVGGSDRQTAGVFMLENRAEWINRQCTSLSPFTPEHKRSEPYQNLRPHEYAPDRGGVG